MSDPKDKANSPPPTGKTLAKMTGGAPIQAIVPTSLGECFSLAEMMFKTGLSIPRDVDTPQKLTMILMKGMEIGLPPMASMECLGIINGKVCLHTDGIPGLLWSRGFKILEWYENEGDLENIIAHCKITRPEGDEYVFKYSAQDARDNKLWDTREKDSKGNPNKAPWFRFKKRMVRMRCRGWLARDCASDVLKGVPIYEEQRDIELDRSDYREVRPAALEVPDDIPDASAMASEAEDNQDALLANPQKHLEELEASSRMAKTEEEFNEIWAAHQDLVEAGRLLRAYQEEAETIKEKHAKKWAKT